MTAKPGLAIAHNQLYVIQPNGAIFGNVERFNAWVKLESDGNPDTIWAFSARVDGTPDTARIAAGGDHLYPMHNGGMLFALDAANGQWTNTEGSGDAGKIVADGWTRIDGKPDSKNIVAGGGELYQQHALGVWKYTGGTWTMVDDNPSTLHIAVGGAGLYQRQKERIHKYDGSQWNVVMDAEMTDLLVGDTALYVRNDTGVVQRYKDGDLEWFGLAPVPDA